MDEPLVSIVGGLRERFPDVCEPVEFAGEVSVEVPRAHLLASCASLRGHFELLVDWSAVDYLGVNESDRRFLCAAHLASMRAPLRLRLRVWVPEGDPTCPSLTRIWPGADYQEREIFDFFGITFEGHPNMRRIFMPDEWDGHPQRKDYPLGGINVEYHHGAFIPPPDLRREQDATSGYPGRIS